MTQQPISDDALVKALVEIREAEQARTANPPALPVIHSTELRITTTYNKLPIPTRQYDWSAIDRNTYCGAEDSRIRNQIGYGSTELLAIKDLIDQLVSLEDRTPAVFSTTI